VTFKPLTLDLRQTIQWLTVAGVFLPTAFLSRIFPTVLEFGALLVGVALLARTYGKLPVSRNLLRAFFFLLFYESVLIAWIHYPADRFVNQYIMLFLFCLFYYVLFQYSRNDIPALFQKYLKLSLVVSGLAVLQFFVYLLFSFNLFQIFTAKDLGAASPTVGGIFLRVNGTVMEPGLLATLLTPAVAYHILAFKNCNRRHTLLLLFAMFLTFSTIGYVVSGLILADKLLFRSSRRVRSILWPAVFLLTVLVVGRTDTGNSDEKSVFSEITTKIGDSFDGIRQLQPEYIEMLNLSSYATLMNLYVAHHAPNRLTGTGLGNHPYNYEKVYVSDHPAYGLNKYDGYSLLIRLYSETGLIGLSLFFLFVGRNYNRNSLINSSIVFLIVSFMLRGGHYTLNGTVFFFFMYYWTRKTNRAYELSHDRHIGR